MRKLFALIITLQLFTNQEAFAEASKLPFLFRHYCETANGESFLGFLYDHYADAHGQQEDHEHGKLPFKHSHDGCTHHLVQTNIKDTKTENSVRFLPISGLILKSEFTEILLFPTFQNLIWQPPKRVN